MLGICAFCIDVDDVFAGSSANFLLFADFDTKLLSLAGVPGLQQCVLI